MKSHPPDKPNFVCSACRELMCYDCASMAAEYEFLFEQRTAALITAQANVELLSQEVARWKRRAEVFEQVAKMGFSEIMNGYIDSLAEKVMKTENTEKGEPC